MGTASVVSEKPMPEETRGVNVQLKGTRIPDVEIIVKESSETKMAGVGKNKTDDEMSCVKKTVAGEEQESDTARSSGQDGLASNKHPDTRSGQTTIDEGIRGRDVPAGLDSEHLQPSGSEAPPASASPPLKPEPQKQQGLFRRSKKKSQGNLSMNSNKDCVCNASLSMRLNGKSLFILILLHLMFYILCMGYVSIC